MAVGLCRYLIQNSSCTVTDIVKSKYFTISMLAIVMSNTIIMIFETYDSFYKVYSEYFLLLEKVYLFIYIIESGLKIWAYSWKFFKNLWNCFDLLIIIFSIVDIITQELINDSTQTLQIDHNQHIQLQIERINNFLRILRILRVIRSFRALRVLRTIRFIQSLHTIVKTCSKALPAMASITFIMIIITTIAAIIARNLFGEICPEKFDNLVKTYFSLFTLLTLDDWYSIYSECSEHNYAYFQLMFCLIYILISNFILLNLLMAVLVDSFQDTLDDDKNKRSQLDENLNLEHIALNNLSQLVDEYCISKPLNDETITSLNSFNCQNTNDSENLSHQYRDKQSLMKIEKLLKHYYMLIESLEFRMERHEQLTKLARKAIKLTLIDQESRKMATKK